MDNPLGRAVAVCVGAFALCGDNLWWIDVRPLPGWILILPAIGLLLWTSRVCALALIGVLLWNSARFYSLNVDAAVPVPFTLVMAGALVLVIRGPRLARFTMPVAVVALAIAFPIAQVFFFGKTSYAREADVIAVFGARCYADGKPSDTLKDRVRTACRLYREGYAPRLFFSGGPGGGAVHETEAMTRLAVSLGVPRAAITVDEDGLNTHATVAHTPPGRVLAVSHFYHLPRIKLAYRAAGRTAYTVPAEEAYFISQTPYLVAREVPAFWLYYVRSLGNTSIVHSNHAR